MATIDVRLTEAVQINYNLVQEISNIKPIDLDCDGNSDRKKIKELEAKIKKLEEQSRTRTISTFSNELWDEQVAELEDLSKNIYQQSNNSDQFLTLVTNHLKPFFIRLNLKNTYELLEDAAKSLVSIVQAIEIQRTENFLSLPLTGDNWTEEEKDIRGSLQEHLLLSFATLNKIENEDNIDREIRDLAELETELNKIKEQPTDYPTFYTFLNPKQKISGIHTSEFLNRMNNNEGGSIGASTNERLWTKYRQLFDENKKAGEFLDALINNLSRLEVVDSGLEAEEGMFDELIASFELKKEVDKMKTEKTKLEIEINDLEVRRRSLPPNEAGEAWAGFFPGLSDSEDRLLGTYARMLGFVRNKLAPEKTIDQKKIDKMRELLKEPEIWSTTARGSISLEELVKLTPYKFVKDFLILFEIIISQNEKLAMHNT